MISDLLPHGDGELTEAERSLYCDTTAFCASNSINSHVGCCDDSRPTGQSCTVWTTCLALSESAKYTTNNGLTLWCGFTDYPNCITHIYADTTAKASALNGYTLLGCAVAAGTDKIYYNAFTSSKPPSSTPSIILTPKVSSSSTIPDIQNNPETTPTPSPNPNAGGVVSVLTTFYDTVTSDGVVYTTATATATVPASGLTSGGGGSTTKSKSSTPVGAIAGGVVGGVAALALIAFGIWFLMRKKSSAAAAEASPPPPPAPQPTIPAVAQVPPAAGYYAGGRESIAKPPFGTYDNAASPSPPLPQSPVSPYQQSTPSPPPPSSGGGHYSAYGAAALGAGAAAGYAAGGYGQQQQQQGYHGYQNAPPPQGYQNQQSPQQQQMYQNQQPQQNQGYQNQAAAAAGGYGYQQQGQGGYPQQGQYPQQQQQQGQYPPHGGYAPPPPQGQQGYVSELPTQRGDGEVRELQG